MDTGSNYSGYKPLGGAAACSGAFHQKTLACMVTDKKPVFLATEYGCAFNFSHEAVDYGETRNTSNTCQGAESVMSESSAGADDGAPDVTKERMESMLEDLFPDGDSDTFPESPDDESAVDMQSLLDVPDVAITCNGKDATLLAPCHGTLQIAVEGPDVDLTETCQGWWFPVPAPRVIFACTGEWAVSLSSKAGGGGGVGGRLHGAHRPGDQGDVCSRVSLPGFSGVVRRELEEMGVWEGGGPAG